MASGKWRAARAAKAVRPGRSVDDRWPERRDGVGADYRTAKMVVCRVPPIAMAVARAVGWGKQSHGERREQPRQFVQARWSMTRAARRCWGRPPNSKMVVRRVQQIAMAGSRERLSGTDNQIDSGDNSQGRSSRSRWPERLAHRNQQETRIVGRVQQLPWRSQSG